MPRRDLRHATGRAGRWLPVLLVLALLGSSVAAYHYDLGPRWFGIAGGQAQADRAQADRALADRAQAERARNDPAAVEPPKGLVLPVASPPRVVAPRQRAGAGLDPRRVRRVLAEGLREQALGPRVHAAVADLRGAEPVFTRGRGTAVPASTMKLLTTVAALEVLGPAHTFRTRVVAGRRANQVVLVGGGDPLLAGPRLTDAERDAVYPGRADIGTLAASTARALAAQGRNRVRLGYDSSLFSGPPESPHWREDYVPDGIVSPITALWVDQGRPATGASRVADPAQAAARAFAAELEANGITVATPPRELTAPAGAPELAAVESAPLGLIAQRVIDVSDNEAAEVLLHHVGLAVSGEGSFAAGAEGVAATLGRLGVSTSGAELYDGSGLSRHNRLAPGTLVDVLRLAAADTHPQLRDVITGLPVAGFTGSLAARFESGVPAGRGLVRAKTGTLTGVHGLAGVAVDADGTPLVFVLIADRVEVADTRAARRILDELAAALAGCHCSG